MVISPSLKVYQVYIKERNSVYGKKYFLKVGPRGSPNSVAFFAFFQGNSLAFGPAIFWALDCCQTIVQLWLFVKVSNIDNKSTFELTSFSQFHTNQVSSTADWMSGKGLYPWP